MCHFLFVLTTVHLQHAGQVPGQQPPGSQHPPSGTAGSGGIDGGGVDVDINGGDCDDDGGGVADDNGGGVFPPSALTSPKLLLQSVRSHSSHLSVTPPTPAKKSPNRSRSFPRDPRPTFAIAGIGGGGNSSAAPTRCGAPSHSFRPLTDSGGARRLTPTAPRLFCFVSHCAPSLPHANVGGADRLRRKSRVTPHQIHLAVHSKAV